MSGHDGRNRVLIDKLGMPIATQKDAKIIEPSHNALQLDAVHEEDRERDLVLAYKVQERVLQILGAFSSHVFSLSVHPGLSPGSGSMNLAEGASPPQDKVHLGTKAFG
jgi:hypothetical protein